jgi:hypothetical protein
MVRVTLTPPFAGVDRRTVWLRLVILSGCLLGLLASRPLWSNGRLYPLVPITPWFPILPAPWDTGCYGAMLLALVFAVWFYRPAVMVFLLVSLYAFCEDQNRGQPWLYMYWTLLCFTLLPAPVSMAACRCAISVAYIWSGIQKCNARFFQIEPAWFVEPAANWHLPAIAMELLRWGVACTPFMELGIGLALWLPRLRRAAIGATIVVHAAAMLFLGPLGHNYNQVIWPWNVAMIALVCVLFVQGDSGSRQKGGLPKKTSPVAAETGLAQTIAQLRQSLPGLAMVALYSFLPALSYAGWWDSYFSFSLYSDNTARANIFVTRAFADRLPPGMRAQVKPFGPTYDPEHQGPFEFVYVIWCYEELGVLPIPEPRAFRSMFKFLRSYSRDPGDLRMIVGQRAGPVIFYEGEERQFLTPN